MIAYINGIKVEGTPYEIEEYKKITSQKQEVKEVKTLCNCFDWRDVSPSPFCKKCGGTGSY